MNQCAQRQTTSSNEDFLIHVLRVERVDQEESLQPFEA
jgi:hypothetical protein